jgi:hypothetical protein
VDRFRFNIVLTSFQTGPNKFSRDSLSSFFAYISSSMKRSSGEKLYYNLIKGKSPLRKNQLAVEEDTPAKCKLFPAKA